MRAIHPLRYLNRHTSQIAALVVMALCASIPAGAYAAPTRLSPRTPTARADSSPRDDARLITKLDGGFEAIESLVDQARTGVPFAPHEFEIMDAWRTGLPIAQIEAHVLLSRALYNVYVAGYPQEKIGDDLLGRWRAYYTANALQIQQRNLKLNDGLEQSVEPPDGSHDWQLYWDPALYNQLSSAFQNRLERKFGLRGRIAPGNKGSGSVDEGQLGPGFPNVAVNNRTADTTTADTQSETSLVLGTGNNILVSFNDSGSNIAPNASFTGIARSTDAGVTFTDQGRLPASATSDAGDPVYARNNVTGRIVIATLGFNSGAVLQSFRTDNDGATYMAPIDCDGGGTSNDKEWIACDNAAGTGQGNFYNFYRDFGGSGGMSFVRSTDGAATWSARQVLEAGGQGAWVSVASDHTVYATWLAGQNMRLRKSTDQGVTFSAAATINTIVTAGVNGDLGLTGGFRSNAFPYVVHHPSNANELYLCYNDRGVAAGDQADVFLRKSTDGGATWTPRFRVNSDATTTAQWQPVIAMNPDGQSLFISWYDRRLNGTAIDVYGTELISCGSGFATLPDYRITTASFPVVIGQDPGIVSTYMGDYDQAVADSGFFYRAWGDNRDSLLTHTNQPDVRFTKIARTPVGSFPASIVKTTQSLIAENCTPANSAIDPGETVTVSLGLQNVGGGATSSLVATLQATGGVTSPSAPQNYGALSSCSASSTMNFSFVASGVCGGTITATLQLQDGVSNLGTVSYTFVMGVSASQTFTNASAITITDNAAATPYPSAITVSGVTAYTRVTLTLNGFSHTFPDDVDIIVVAPGGQKAYVMSDNGSGTDVSGAVLTFDDTAAAALTTAAISSGTFKPSNLDTTTDALPAPAPAPPFLTDFTSLSALGAGANGTWNLFVRDDVSTDSGSISGGWSLTFVNPNVCSTTCGGGNLPPVANAGMDQSVNSCTMVSLNGSGSSDPDSGPNPLTFAWSQTAGPTVVINSPTSATPTFEAPNVATSAVLTFQLTVSDSLAMNSDTISVTANHVNGVHVDTVGLYTDAGNTFFLRNCNGPGPADVTTFFGPNALVPITGDWDNNGTSTVGIYDPTSGCFFLRNANTPGPADITVCFGPANQIPIVGDWDGNGSVTVGVYDNATGTFFLRNSNTPGPADLTFTFGAGGATPLAGDWDANGTTTIGIYIEASGVVFLRNTNTPGGADVIFSYGPGTGFKPLVGNWDGLGGDSIGLFSPATGAVFLRNTNSSGPADIVFMYGVGGAVTGVAGNWDGF